MAIDCARNSSSRGLSSYLFALCRIVTRSKLIDFDLQSPERPTQQFITRRKNVIKRRFCFRLGAAHSLFFFWRWKIIVDFDWDLRQRRVDDAELKFLFWELQTRLAVRDHVTIFLKTRRNRCYFSVQHLIDKRRAGVVVFHPRNQIGFAPFAHARR